MPYGQGVQNVEKSLYSCTRMNYGNDSDLSIFLSCHVSIWCRALHLERNGIVLIVLALVDKKLKCMCLIFGDNMQVPDLQK